MKGLLFDIQRASLVDGPGFRTTVFFKGCNLRCAWCHNPESQSFSPQLLVYPERCTHCGLCAQVCPQRLQSCLLCGACTKVCPQEARSLCGEEYSVEEVMQKLLADQLFYAASDGGATFSGGECLLQIDFLEALLMACKEKSIHTAVDTAGAVSFDRFERILPHTDLFLYDIKCMDAQKHKAHTGRSNEVILANLARLLQMKKHVWVRMPIIPGVNDTEDEMAALRAFLLKNGYPEKVELLPYHRMGESKARAMGKTPPLFDIPTPQKLDLLKKSVQL